MQKSCHFQFLFFFFFVQFLRLLEWEIAIKIWDIWAHVIAKSEGMQNTVDTAYLNTSAGQKISEGGKFEENSNT